MFARSTWYVATSLSGSEFEKGVPKDCCESSNWSFKVRNNAYIVMTVVLVNYCITLVKIFVFQV